ncbi:hypothetical protein BC629DRAFT_791096 [Irpex lacteus]|nr:hypothetical protein BC629DRAFT_791096 [Irpex lacteus]
MPSTPPRSTVPLGATFPSVTDTPSKSKQVVSAPILLGNKIDDSRDALLSDIGPAVPQVTIQWFKDSIMPPLPAGLDMPAVIKRLKAEKCITPDGVLAQFTTVPANARDHEDDVFKPLTSLAANMGNIAEEFLGEKPTVLFQCNPTRAPESRRKNSTRPDGYGRYTAHPCHKKSNRQVFWAEIVAPGEFKKVKNAKNTNDDHTTLAHFFLSQMYAKDDELGYDPTMKLAKDQTKYKNQYDITIHHLALGSGGADSDSIDVSKTKPVVLRTEKLISDIGAEALRSRGTRVWHARVLTGELKGTLMVIKDYWVDHDRLREPEIRARILADAQTEEDKATLEQHLLTPQYFGDVVIRGKRDNTLTLLRRGAVVPTDMTYLTIHDSGSGLLSDILEDRPGAPLGTGTIMAAPPQTPKPILFHDKSHTRIAFLERAVTIDNIRSLGFVFTIAVETVKALRALHKSGWVHRDISAGNLLIVAGVVKISDLEYAKRMDDPTTHEHGRSPGTPMFQSVEAEAHRYRFLPRQLKPPGPSSKGKKPKPVVLPPPFRYNPLHDLESLWWLLVWLLLVRKADIDGDTEQRRYDQHAFYHRLYTSQRFRKSA